MGYTSLEGVLRLFVFLGGGGGVITRGTFFYCLLVNGPITGGFICGGKRLKSSSLL